MTDADIIYRWLTQAELDTLLAQAYQRGAEAARDKIVNWYDTAPVVTSTIMRRLPLPEGK